MCWALAGSLLRLRHLSQLLAAPAAPSRFYTFLLFLEFAWCSRLAQLAPRRLAFCVSKQENRKRGKFAEGNAGKHRCGLGGGVLEVFGGSERKRT
uniref:Putative secreted protein n=1 Tax=Ixodes ricinus TaxID=34613 RepID=A0A6B0UF17_IXORI